VRNQSEQVTELLLEFGNVPLIGIEIGTGDASISKSILLDVPNVQMIYSIDPYELAYDPTSEFEARLPIEEHQRRKANAQKSFDYYPGRYTFIIDTSDNAVSKTPDDVDFVWIDGDHNHSQIYKDIINYYPKVKIGGIFGGHDYHHVIPIFREMITGVIYLGDDWTWWIRKDSRCLRKQG
jgi:sulfite reductase beta subunit-like hemoprotein